MWRAPCKRGTGEIVCDNVKDETGIIFLSISLLQKLLLFVRVCSPCLLRFPACLLVWSFLLANTQRAGSLRLLCSSQRGRPQSHTRAALAHTHTSVELCFIHIVTLLTSVCVCVTVPVCVWVSRVVGVRGEVKWVPSNERRQLRRNWQNISHTHTQAVTTETTLSEQHVNCRCALCLGDYSILCFDPVARHRVCDNVW